MSTRTAYVRPRYFPWAELLRRTFEIENRAVIERILAHLGLPLDMPRAAPARSTEWLPGVLSEPEADAGSEWFDWPASLSSSRRAGVAPLCAKHDLSRAVSVLNESPAPYYTCWMRGLPRKRARNRFVWPSPSHLASPSRVSDTLGLRQFPR